MESKKRWWISTSTFNWFDRINKKSINLENNKIWDGLIYFDSKKDIDEFCEKLKKFIKDNYPRAKSWYDE